MAVRGSKNGLVPSGNLGIKRVEPLITVPELINTYLFGLNITDLTTGKPLPESAYQQYITNAVSWLEHYLDIAIAPVRNYVEDKDYYFNQYTDWGFLMLDNFPVIQVRKIELVYFRDENGDPEVLQEIPQQWIRLSPHDGLIRFIPNARFPANLQVGQTGNYFPEILRTEHVPSLWRITYDYGFEDGCIPALVNQAIAYLAAIQALIVGGNLIIGAGIASSSISLDGLSQAINTTQSAENSGYSATIKDYGDKVFGANKDDPFAILKLLKTYYKGQGMDLI
jgi:hypothetical protein